MGVGMNALETVCATEKVLLRPMTAWYANFGYARQAK